MELAVYLANTKKLLDLDNVLHPLERERIPQTFSVALASDGNSEAEYTVHMKSLQWLGECCKDGKNEISRLYFGQEFCEHLIPRRAEVEKAYYIGRQLGWEFTYVTGYVTDAGLALTVENLAFLAAQEGEIEVVVNDFGVLATLAREYPGLRPVLGRLLIKQMRLARYPYASSPPPFLATGIDSDAKIVRAKQLATMRRINLSIPAYRAALERLGVRRVDLDIVPQGLDMPTCGWAVGCYYPWGYVTGGRNCMTAGILDPKREHMVRGGACPRPCLRVNRSGLIGDFPEVAYHRGNSVFAFSGDYAEPYLDGTLPIDRIIYEPYIPIS